MRRSGIVLLILAGSLWLQPLACQEHPSISTRLQPAIGPGEELYQRLSCHGCHLRRGRGGEVGPTLDGLGSRLSRKEMETQLLTPRRRQADSRMPSFAFVRPREIQTLLDFLQSL